MMMEKLIDKLEQLTQIAIDKLPLHSMVIFFDEYYRCIGDGPMERTYYLNDNEYFLQADGKYYKLVEYNPMEAID